MKSRKESENTSGQIKLKTQLSKNLWDAAKLFSEGSSYQHRPSSRNKTKQNKKSQINNLIYHLKELEKEEQTNPKSAKGRK